MEKIFKKGDRVFDIEYGWGTVHDIESIGRNAVIVDFDDKVTHSYLFDGKYPAGGGNPRKVLSFTEYTLEGFSQERPEELPKKGDIVWVRDEFPSIWRIGHFYDKVDNKYQVTTACSGLDGWTHSGVEIRTTNPYENEQD